ncbi:expressed unknown protein [Seminavis robusta]|uniref:Sulfotransferase n=1 Tax=Seminavis robusta TaxID=568900 RepID=A0A9N8E7E4_9STRA|nr:expressed unknown protein [Seminavis robusta]|eukprot:Sro592_g172210.1 n/a (552) ;mRNA; f:55228-56954
MRLVRRKRKRPQLQGRSNRNFLWICCVVVAIGVTLSLVSFIPVSSRFNPSEIWKKTGIELATSGKMVFHSTGMEANWGLTTAAQDWRNYDANRTIAFIHIGKAGGLTVRSSTGLVCRPMGVGKKKEIDGQIVRVVFNQSEEQVETCVNKRFYSNLTLPRQVKYYFHMHGHRPEELAKSTSFLVVLRHPVDRLISSYRYSHPANCRGKLRKGPFKPYGCHIEESSQTRGTADYQVHRRCWPSPGMEDFAQAVLSPYAEFNTSHLANETLQYQKESPKLCRRMAHRMARGLGPIHPNPHMLYNYEYYMNRTVLKYPDKEVFGIRTEHEWKDLGDLDVALGGAAAYQKMCCVLEREIFYYLKLLFKVKNLDDDVKQKGLEKVRTSCGIGSQSLDEWRTQCQARIEQDRPLWEVKTPPKQNRTAMQQNRRNRTVPELIHTDMFRPRDRTAPELRLRTQLQGKRLPQNATRPRRKRRPQGPDDGPTLYIFNETADPEGYKARLRQHMKTSGVQAYFTGDAPTREAKKAQLLDRLHKMGVHPDNLDGLKAASKRDQT